jgi:Leucine-rich repeat (LRR) protein
LTELELSHTLADFNTSKLNFTILTKVSDLFLNDLNIHSLMNLRFSQITILCRLHLKSNRITSIARNDFTSNKFLWDLNLANNQIEFIESGSLSQVSSLMILDLSGNCIRSPPEISFESMTWLYLNNNQLSDLRVNTTLNS